MIEDGAGNFVRTLATSFARNADNDAVSMSYAVTGSTVTITVDHRAVEHPVLVDTRVEEWDTLEALRALRGLGATLPPDDDFATAVEIDSPFDRITPEEKRFCRESRNTLPCPIFYLDAYKATALTKYLFGSDRGAGRGNAFRHAYWTALMVGTAWNIGGSGYVSAAIELAVAHEGRYFNSTNANTALASWMDLENNSVGYSLFWQDPEMDDEVVCLAIRRRARSGALQRIRSKWRTGQMVFIENVASRFVAGRGCGPA